jgi:photosystem II stability/assembly factor-like uncharacterized protein
MRHGRFAPALVAVLVTAGIASPARAAWEDWVPAKQVTDADDLLLAVDAVSPVQIVMAGISLKASNPAFPIPTMSPVVYRTQDGGQTVQSLHGNLPEQFGGWVNAVAFTDVTTGWAALGADVWRTTNAGGKWIQATLGSDLTVNDLARFDANTGVAVGTGGRAWRTTDGGATWNAVETGTGADLLCVFFVDGRKGFAAGASSHVETVSGPEGNSADLQRYDDSVVLGTTDGGRTWKVLATLAKDEAADGAGGKKPCPMHFLADMDNGWLVLSRYDSEKERTSESLLYRTRDGGKTWTDTKSDFQVGTLSLMNAPIRVSLVAGMTWKDTLKGHLVGAADTGAQADDGSGNPQPIYRSADLVTADGGKTWTKTDIGVINPFGGMGGGEMPTGDPRPTKGLFLDWFNGVLVGEKGKVWRYRMRCDKQSACAPDGVCDKRAGDDYHYCYPATDTGPDGSGGDAAADRDVWGGTDLAWNDGVAPTLDLPACEGDGCPKARGGGCAGGPGSGGSGAWPAVTALGFLLVLARRARR